ncbi:MAG: GspE/PulE family protein [Patescibacteria group bacterium]
MSFLNFLAGKKIIKEDDIPFIEEEVSSGGRSLEEILAKRGISSEELLASRGDYLNIPSKSLGEQAVAFEVLRYIPEKTVNYYKIVPLGVVDGVLEVGIVDPDNIEARDALQFISSKINMPYKLFLVSEGDFERVLKSYSGLSGEVGKALTELESELSADELELSKKLEETKSKKGSIITEDAPVTKIVATMLRHAVEGGASDVHVEHLGEKIRVRFRVDGKLNTSLILPQEVHSSVVARIKILSNMKLDEKRKPQDGSFSAHIDGRRIDFRVSTFPASYGEKVVMRILDSEKSVWKLDEMGFSQRNLETIKKAISRSYGLILISGPTGSGKSTTLYAMLNEMDRETNNVLSLEDPIEYNITGVSQSQVRPEIGYTFANGLRTTLRQDPDIIMVGEIRDKETAQLAVQAALTGHLVFSTIHTNDAVGVIPRLIDMGVDPYLIAPTLVMAMAQRLVRKICPEGRLPVPVEGSIKLMLDKQFEDLPAEFKKEINIPKEVYNAGPSPTCASGTRGRSGVFEVLEMNHSIEEIILKSGSDDDIYQAARKNGMLTMKEDAILKAFDGVIPFEEVNTL